MRVSGRASARALPFVLASMLTACTGSNADSDDTTADDGTAGASGARKELSRLGGECDADNDCPEGATCLTADDHELFGGGAPHGVCTADCSKDADACDAFDQAVCVDTTAAGGSERALCLEACDFGDPEALESKCHGRLDVACEELDDTSFCRPLCMTDADCGVLGCDRLDGVCRSAELVTPDLHFGTECDADAEEPGCSGLCLELDAQYAICSHRCTFGDASDCAAAGSKLPSACVLVSPGGTLGDVGYCAELCDCNDDCASAAGICASFDDEVLEDTFGYLGSCTSAFEDSDSPNKGLPCP
jgi:hypothetical protein